MAIVKEIDPKKGVLGLQNRHDRHSWPLWGWGMRIRSVQHKILPNPNQPPDGLLGEASQSLHMLCISFSFAVGRRKPFNFLFGCFWRGIPDVCN